MFGTFAVPPSEQWLFETLNSMRQDTTEQHQRLRSDMNAGFDKLREELRTDRAAAGGVEKRLTMLEFQRDENAKDSVRRQWGISLAVTILVTVINWLFGWYGKR